MFGPEREEILRRLHQAAPQFVQLLEHMLQEELLALPSRSLDKVQIFQGRCLITQELLADIKHAAGTTANRNAKPNFSTP